MKLYRRRRRTRDGRRVREGLTQFARKTNWNFNRPPPRTECVHLSRPSTVTIPSSCHPLRRVPSILFFPLLPLFLAAHLFPGSFIFLSLVSSFFSERAKCFYARRYYVLSPISSSARRSFLNFVFILRSFSMHLFFIPVNVIELDEF